MSSNYWNSLLNSLVTVTASGVERKKKALYQYSYHVNM